MGKSTTAQMFRDAGVPVWDADAVVHKLYAKGGTAVPLFQKCLPAAVVDGVVDRMSLKTMIAKEPSVLTKVESFVHPLVAEDRVAFLENQDVSLVVFDIPLLFETGAEDWLSSVLVVTVPFGIQKERVMARPGMTEAQFDQMIARQMPDAEKTARADHVIITKDMESTRKAVENLIAKLTAMPENDVHA